MSNDNVPNPFGARDIGTILFIRSCKYPLVRNIFGVDQYTPNYGIVRYSMRLLVDSICPMAMAGPKGQYQLSLM